MKPELINLSEHARNPDYYNRDRDIAVALAWNAIKKTLSELGKEDLFGYIKSVRLTEKSIVITTGKPIVNTELGHYREKFLTEINMSLKTFQVASREKLRFL